MPSSDNPKIDELRARLASDPGSRMFVPLGEELRKAGHAEEAERILREGIEKHPAYLSAWVTLGRLLGQQERHGEAVEALNRALQIDPENVVAARLAADSYLALGEKVEAIKKFKLVHAFIPSDMEVQSSIESLERQLNPEKYIRPIRVTEEIPEFRDVADIHSPLPAGEGSEDSFSPLPAGEGSGVRASFDDPFDGPESEPATASEQFSFEGPESEVTYDMNEVTEVATWSSLTPDPSPAGRGEKSSLTPDPSPAGRGEERSLTPDPSPAGRGEESSLAPDPSPAGRGEENALTPEEKAPSLSIVPDFEDGRQKTIERLHRWLVLMQRSQHRND